MKALLLLALGTLAQQSFAASVYTESFDYSDEPLLLFGASQAALNVDFGKTFDSIDFLVVDVHFVDDLFDPGERMQYSVNLGTGGASGYIVQNSSASPRDSVTFTADGRNGCTICPTGVFLDGEGFIRVSAYLGSSPSSAYVDSIDVSIIGVAAVPLPAAGWLFGSGLLLVGWLRKGMAKRDSEKSGK